MKSAVPLCMNPTDWRSLYRAAIMETNRSIVNQKVSEAEEAVMARARELFYDHGSREERNALDAARCALRALRSTLQHA